MKYYMMNPKDPKPLLKHFITSLVILICLVAPTTEVSATQFRDDLFSSAKASKKNRVKPSRQCLALKKKRNQPHSKPLFAKQWKPQKSERSNQAEVDQKTVAKITTPTPKPSPKPATPPSTTKSAEKTDKSPESKPVIPAPVNDKQAMIRKEVEKELANQKSGEHLEVEPLYFITGQEEFAFMDMEPFLKAVEFAYQGKLILIEGHTDSNGKAEDNLKLSMRRVDRIKQLMVDIGISEHQISVIGYGESEPKYDNKTEEGRQKNRRVDFKVF